MPAIDAGTVTAAVFAELTVGPRRIWGQSAPAGGIPARVLRAVNPGELCDLARVCARAEKDVADGLLAQYGADGPGAFFADHARVAASASKRPGSRGHGVDHYLLWAVRYAECTERNRNRALARIYADELGKTEDKAAAYIRDTIHDCRVRYGFLTTYGQGRAGGDLTEKARRLLAERSAK